jgi:hypothetical protein
MVLTMLGSSWWRCDDESNEYGTSLAMLSVSGKVSRFPKNDFFFH